MPQVQRFCAHEVADTVPPSPAGLVSLAILKPTSGVSVQVLLLLLDNADECLENEGEAFRQTVRHAPHVSQSVLLTDASVCVLVQLKELSSLDRVRVVVTCRNIASLVMESAADGLNVWEYPVSDELLLHCYHIVSLIRPPAVSR